MPVIDNKKYIIIQMIEKATGDYHYPVTLYEAIMDSAGDKLDDILQRKMDELGLTLKDDLSDVLDNMVEGEFKEIREVLEGINKKLSVRESQIAYLATNWLTGTLKLEMSEISKLDTRTVYYAEVEPENPIIGDYWESSIDKSLIKEYTDKGWVKVSENTAIMIYGLTSSYVLTRGQFTISSGKTPPTHKPTDLSTIGDIYIYVGEEVLPYIWLGTVWSNLSNTSDIVGNVGTSIDPLIDLISSRYLTVTYSKTKPPSEYWYDGTSIKSNYTVTDGLSAFLKSLFPVDYADYTSLSRRVFLGPRKPTLSTGGDAWIDTRSYRVYLNTSDTTEPNWVQQLSATGSVSNLNCTNLFTKSERFDAHVDRSLWQDIRTGEYSSLAPVETIDGHGVQEVSGVNRSISQRVRIRPNTMYTYSVYLKAKDPNQLPNMYFLADGCEVVSTSLVNGSILSYSDEYTLHYLTFISGPQVTDAVCRLETPSGYPFRLHSPCLQEGSSFDWTPSIKDVLTVFSEPLQNITQTIVVSREKQPSVVRDSYLWISNNGTSLKSRHSDKWVDINIDSISNLASAIDSLYSIYTAPGETVFITSHNAPTSVSIGDYWIKDDLSAVRYTGTGWGNVSGVLASEQKVISTRISKSNDTLVRTVFLESSINVDDLFNLAYSVDPTIRLYKQSSTPTDAHTGDIWSNTSTGGILRYNGVSWVPYGSAKVSSLEQDVSGLRSEVSEVYDGGSGRNLIRESRSIDIPSSPYALYTSLEHDKNYVFSVQFSSASIITQYRIRVMNAAHTLDYDSTILQVGNTVQIWRFSTTGIPAGVTPHLVVTYSSSESNLSLSMVQLEVGKLYTDWKPSQDDTAEQLGDLNDSVNRIDNDLSDQSAKVDTISEDLQEAIRKSNEALSRSVTVEQTASSLTVTSTALTRRVTDVEDVLDTYNSVFEFKPEGLEISSRVNGVRSDISTYYRSNGMYFWSASAGTDVGYVTADGINIRNARVQVGGILAMGNYQWKPRSTGAVSLIYLPG